MTADVPGYGYGYVVISGQLFGITRVALQDSEIKITFCIPPGPMLNGSITVFGADGKGCWQGNLFNLQARDEPWMCTYGLRINHVDDQGLEIRREE